MNLKIKRVLAFAMTLAMLLGCFMFSTSAADMPGTGDIVCTATDNDDGLSVVVREGDINGINNGYTMYFYESVADKSGWVRPFVEENGSAVPQWNSSPAFAEGKSYGDTSVADWCKKNVTTVVIHSGVKNFANYAFNGYTALKYVGLDWANCTTLEKSAMTVRSYIFNGCTLNAIYNVGDTPIDGVADLTKLTTIGRDHSNNDSAFSRSSGIRIVKLGSNVDFYATKTFDSMKDLEAIQIAATSANNVNIKKTRTDSIYLGVAVLECENKDIADKLVSQFGDDKVTYAGKTVTTKFAQTSKVENSKYSVRFAAVGNDTDYQVVGFKVIALNVEGKVWSEYTSTVYNSVAGTNASGTFTVTAAEHAGKYIYTITVKDIPTSVGEVTFLVRPTYDSNDTTCYGHSETFTVGGAN